MHGNGYVEDCTSHTRIEGISPELYHQVLGHWFSGGVAVGGARVNRGKNMKTAEAQSRIPIVDVAPLLQCDARGEDEVARQIGQACRGIGFFYIRGHGVTPDEFNGVFGKAAEFFTSSAAVKASAAFTGAGGNRGYIQLGGESLDPSKPPDMKEAFNVGLATMLAYFDHMWQLGKTLHRAFALDLGLDPSYFDDKFKKPMATLRLLHYPPVDKPLDEDQLGAGQHTDYGNVTLLATDSSGGLMVRDRSGHWLDAPVVPGAYICNIGDCLMRWTNDIYVSTPHKVVTPPGKDRYSIAFFLDPDPDAVVACLPTCTDAGRPPKYAPVSGADFLRSRLEPTYRAAE